MDYEPMYEPSNLDSLEALQRKCVEMEIALSNCYHHLADIRRKEIMELAGKIAASPSCVPVGNAPKTPRNIALMAITLHNAIEAELVTPLPVGGGACGASDIEDARSGLLGKVSKQPPNNPR